ncbi:hypothetical protein HHL19_23810 [Streptomyces sp. R302]|uniref:hypothetical protein n=1 Tax=unclassified Streptomyces TaxID=2593676 RepID=UPI00145ECF8F|nr:MULTISPECIES: hypothetical protein [unclassified Streptomyces]NML51975.1 hypothetical protein [Streptomyces sp. R301]NML81595.1 hypothetical protein [Streptomyces sp. R302]
MTLTQGLRVRLAADLRVAGAVTAADDPAEEPAAVAGALLLGAGTEGVVERVDAPEEPRPDPEAAEYERLVSLLESFGAQMPPASRERAEEQARALEPAWNAYRNRRPVVTARVRLDGGLVLERVREDVLTAL